MTKEENTAEKEKIKERDKENQSSSKNKVTNFPILKSPGRTHKSTGLPALPFKEDV